MITANRFRANQKNAAKSTGPRSPGGKATAALNGVKAGLFARALVLPALGETVEDFAAFRDAVAANLEADGVLEVELAERVAQLLWRVRRVPLYESAALSATPLPPCPDEVQAWRGEMYLPVPQTVSTAERLARARTRVLTARNAAAVANDALALAKRLGQEQDGQPFDNNTVQAVLDAVGDVLGWDRYAKPGPWAGVLHHLGAKPACCFKVRWTLDLLRRAVDHAAATNGRTAADVMVQAVGALRAEVEAAAENVRRREVEEAALVETLLAERCAAAARAVYADEGVIQRVARAESHLSRELDRALAALERVRAARAKRETSPVDPVGLGSFCKTARRN
jgi:hypothetical protein